MNLINRPLSAAAYMVVFLTLVVTVPRSLRAQSNCWTGSGPVTTNCSVGIATTTPNAGLQVNEGPEWSSWNLGANIVIGGGRNNALGFLDYSGSNPWAIADAGDLQFYVMPPLGNTSTNPMPVMTLATSGLVGIGTTNPTYPLQVNGTIAASEVVVTTSLSDYVFAPDYYLRPLKEVAAYVKENHHLPDIPSDAEARQTGVSLGDMQSKLLAKIEELTLHMIRAEERNNQLENQVKNLQGRLASVERSPHTEGAAK